MGFTLIELVAVMAIMGVVFMIAQPRLSSFVVRDRVRRAARRVQMDLRLAQNKAIRLRTRTGVVFDPAKDLYVVWYWDVGALPPGWAGFRAAHAVGARKGSFVTRDQAVALGADPDYLVGIESTTFASDTVQFDAYGIPDSGGDIVVGAGRSRITISVNQATGKTTVSGIGESTSDLVIDGAKPPTDAQIVLLKP